MMYICQYCGRILKYPVAHRCRDGFRKRKLKFETIMKNEEETNLEKLIGFLNAFQRGEKLQFRDLNDNSWVDIQYYDQLMRVGVGRIRIKPEPKYRPFKNADEAFLEAKKHGFWVKDESGNYRQICYIYDKGAEISNEYENSYTYDEILSFAWADTGEPCGILEEM